MIPVYGFGGKLPGHKEANHCFPVTLNPSNHEVSGVQGILNAYRNCLKQIRLSGPTYFSHIISGAHQMSSTPYTTSSQHYTILLIITDGIINDMNKTIQSIITASGNPMSIIIVGVGGADFSKMDILDGDDDVLSIGGKRAQRDIVQFVPMKNFRNKSITELSSHVLAEVPGQFLDYMKLKKISPMEPIPPPEYVYSYDDSKESTIPPPSGSSIPPPSGSSIPPPSY